MSDEKDQDGKQDQDQELKPNGFANGNPEPRRQGEDVKQKKTKKAK